MTSQYNRSIRCFNVGVGNDNFFVPNTYSMNRGVVFMLILKSSQ